MSQEYTVTGSVRKLTYVSPDGSFTILKMDVDEAAKKAPFVSSTGVMTACGDLPGVKVGNRIAVTGIPETSKYGPQLKVSSFQEVDPSELGEIAKYLCNNVHQIGPKYARDIVAVFGKDTFKVLDETPDRLYEIKGVGAKRVEEVKKTWKEQRGVRKILEFFTQIGVSSKFATKFWELYGEETVAIIKADPYRLARDVDGIGFKKADEYATNMGIPEASPQRITAAMEYVIEQKQQGSGDCFQYATTLVTEVITLLGNSRLITPLTVQECMVEAVKRKVLVAEQNRIYLPKTCDAENEVAKKLNRMLSIPLPPQMESAKINALIEEEIAKLPFELAPSQREAVFTTIKSKLSVLTGGPGTGKTTITQVIVNVFMQLKLQITLLAPTGRAAKRMGEVIGMPAFTIHKELHGRDKAHREQGVSLEELMIEGVIFIDESSMVDIKLMRWLLSYVSDTAIIVIVGDKDQLPSVGPGAVLRDLIDSGVIPTSHLSHIFRQAKGSNICIAAAQINQGHMPTMHMLGKQHGIPDSDFLTVSIDDAVEQSKAAVWCATELTKQLGFDPLRDCQVLAPMRKGDAGIEKLNQLLQSALNPNPPAFVDRGFGIRWGVGDKVMQTKNNYRLKNTKGIEVGALNGDIGVISAIYTNEDGRLDSMVVDFDSGPIFYETSKDWDGLVLSYASSIHKMQGSEFPVIIMLVHTSHFTLLQRNLIYTGLTRGKKYVILISASQALSMAVRNNKVSRRNTYLSEKLKVAA